eukprot:GHVO01005651.1.p1 GENE.GHVO01005651.1~~GHVO01005651.1.p1  ORF type:complete len:380 (+),score=70.51 GHVO01005651.1:503-1642(+)
MHVHACMHTDMISEVTVWALGIAVWTFSMIFGYKGLSILLSRKKTSVGFEGNVIVITGGSEGIGKEMALDLIRKKANVIIILSRDKKKLDAAVVEMDALAEAVGRSPLKTRVFGIQCDVGCAETVQKTFARIRDEIGIVDVLVNCAGLCVCDELCRLSADDLRKQTDVNLLGPMYCTQSVIPDMRHNGKGVVVFLLSQGAQVGLYGFTGYSASKFGLRGFAEALRMETIGDGISVITCFPAATNTPGYDAENIRKPSITHGIESVSGLYTAQETARKIVHHMEIGRSHVIFGYSGWVLQVASAGFSPGTIRATDWVTTVAEVLFAGMSRLAGIITWVVWRYQIHAHKWNAWEEERDAYHHGTNELLGVAEDVDTDVSEE